MSGFDYGEERRGYGLHSRPPRVTDTIQGPITAKDRIRIVRAALRPVNCDTGTPYPCTPRLLQIIQGVATKALPHLYTEEKAVRKILCYNNLHTTLSPERQLALHRLQTALAGAWAPDLIIKAFPDFDMMFFGGTLLGRTVIRLGDAADRPSSQGIWLAWTRYTLPRGTPDRFPRIDIWLRGLFQSPPDPYTHMIMMLLQSVFSLAPLKAKQ